MSKIVSRLLTFFIGLPLVILIVSFNWMNHLAMNLVVTVFSVLAANEFYSMLAKDNKLMPRVLILLFTGIIPLSSYLFIFINIEYQVTLWVYICECLLILAIECFSAKNFEKSVTKIAYSLLILFYCGYLCTFISKMTTLPDATLYLWMFFLFVFICDSAAWLFGVLFGKNNRGFVAVSPNKSIAGFAGGIAGSVACGILFKVIFEDRLICSFANIIILALGTAFAAIVGDLIESVFKRATNVKDSGNLIPGRGGVLDSIDSILVAAPIFYIGMYFILNK